MTSITLTKNDQGRLVGLTAKDRRAYARHEQRVAEMDVGEVLQISEHFPRNGKFHRLHFGMLGQIFDAQERFLDEDALRKWLYTVAGFAFSVPGPDGEPITIVQSIAYDKLDDQEFSELHSKVVDAARSEYVTGFLWPHLSPEQRYEIMEMLLAEFEKDGT